MGAAAIALIASAAASAYGSYSQGQQQAQNYKAQAAVAARNAMLQRQQARTARQQAGAEEEAQRRQAAQFLGTQRAAIGQSGIGYGGSAGQLIEDSAIQAELDALNIRYGGEQQAQGLLEQARSSELESGLLRANAKQARAAGAMGAGTSLLSAGAQAYGSGLIGGAAKTGGNLQGQRKPLTNNAAFVRNY